VTLEFSGCSQEGNGSGCQVGGEGETSGTFKTYPLKMELAYTSTGRSGDMAVLFTPVTAKGEKLALIKFHGGSNCEGSELSIVGAMAADIESSSPPIEVGHEPAAAKTLQISFPNGEHQIREVWLEEKGSLVKKYVEPVMKGHVLKVSGTLQVELTSGANWGVFT